jgi:hypothetical protein
MKNSLCTITELNERNKKRVFHGLDSHFVKPSYEEYYFTGAALKC